MRAFTATQFTVTRFGAWRLAVGSLCALVALAVGAWLAGHALRPASGAWVVFTCALSVWLLAVQPRATAQRLRWDGQHWYLGPANSAGLEPSVGDVQVAVDLGVWMLLRFSAERSGGGRAVTWLPVQRRGLEAHWHALRCAVYSPRPDAGVDATPDV